MLTHLGHQQSRRQKNVECRTSQYYVKLQDTHKFTVFSLEQIASDWLQRTDWFRSQQLWHRSQSILLPTIDGVAVQWEKRKIISPVDEFHLAAALNRFPSIFDQMVVRNASEGEIIKFDTCQHRGIALKKVPYRCVCMCSLAMAYKFESNRIERRQRLPINIWKRRQPSARVFAGDALRTMGWKKRGNLFSMQLKKLLFEYSGKSLRFPCIVEMPMSWMHTSIHDMDDASAPPAETHTYTQILFDQDSVYSMRNAFQIFFALSRVVSGGKYSSLSWKRKRKECSNTQKCWWDVADENVDKYESFGFITSSTVRSKILISLHLLFKSW